MLRRYFLEKQLNMARQPFKISPSDYDLLTFEMHVAENHPSFKAMKQGEQPSYEHPDFYQKAIEIDDLPGGNNPYSIFAMNLFGLDEVEDYYWECQVLLERPLSQLVKTEKGEHELKVAMHFLMNEVQFHALPSGKQKATSLARDFDELVMHCCFAWDDWIATNIKAHLSKSEAIFAVEHLDKVVDTCRYVADQLVAIARLKNLNRGVLLDLRVNQKYALLAKSLLEHYQERVVTHVQEYIDDLQGELELLYGFEGALKLDSKRYVDLVLMHELSIRSDKLEREHVGVNSSRDVELKSPNAFIYTRLHGGYNAEDIRVSYRWLFINAWLYSWLKDKDISASKAAQYIAQEDRFFYLNDDKEKLTDDGVKPSMEQLHARRAKSLNTEFSKWKNYKGPFGYISDTLFKKSSKGYRQEQDRKQ